MRLQRGIEMIQHQARFDPGGARRHIHIQNAPQIFAGVDHQRRAGGLAALAGAGAARQHRHFQVARDGDGGGDVARRSGHEHAQPA